MILKTRVFELCNGKYHNLSNLAQAMEISVSQIYRVRQGKRSINQKFLIGTIKAFPEHKLGDLFYFASELPTVSKNCHYAASATHPPISRQQKRSKEESALSKH